MIEIEGKMYELGTKSQNKAEIIAFIISIVLSIMTFHFLGSITAFFISCVTILAVIYYIKKVVKSYNKRLGYIKNNTVYCKKIANLKENFHIEIKKRFKNYTIKICPKNEEDYYLFVLNRNYGNRFKELSDKLNDIENKELEWVLLGNEIIGIKFEKYFFIFEGKEGRPWIMNIISLTTFFGFMLVCFLPVRFLLPEVIENKEILSWLNGVPTLVVIYILTYFEIFQIKFVQTLEKKCILEVQNSSDN